MSNTHTRRFLAVLAALLVVCSAVGAPVAAASTSTFDDGLNGTFGSDDSEDGDSTSDDTNDDTNDGEEDTDSDTNDDTGSDSGDSTSDSTDDDASDGSDGASSSDDSTADATNDSPDDSTADDRKEDDDSSTDVRNRVNDTAGEVNDTVENATDEGGDTDEDSTDDIGWRTETFDYIGGLKNTESLDEYRFEGPYIDRRSGSEPAVETLEVDTGIESDDAVGATVTTTTATLTTVGGTLTSGSGQVLVGTVGTSTASDSDSGFDAIVLDDQDDGPAGAAMSTGGTGGQPVPSAPAGGAAVGLGAVAAVAALRGSAFLPSGAGVGASAVGAFAVMPRFTLASLVDKLRPFFFPLRYSRYDDSDPLEHEARERVYEIVNESPGSYLSELSEEAGLPLSTTRHHVRILEREDLVSGAKLRGKRRFYPAYAEGIELAAALNDDSTASIIDAIARLGSASVSDLAGELGRDPSTITHHLQRLEEDDIIAREREGRAVMNKLSAEARTALEPETVPKPGEPGGAIAGGAD